MLVCGGLAVGVYVHVCGGVSLTLGNVSLCGCGDVLLGVSL